jgi:Leucine-rich repeat (LRR) protein
VSHNALTSLEGLQHCPSLRVLNADHNRISTLDAGLGAAISTWAGKVARQGPMSRIDVTAVLAQAQAAAAARRQRRAAAAAAGGDEEGEEGEGGPDDAEGRAEEELLAGLFGEADAQEEAEDGVADDAAAPRKSARLPLSAPFTSGFAFDDWAEERAFEAHEVRAAAAAVRGGSSAAAGAGGGDDKEETGEDSSIAARWPLAQLTLLSLRHNKLPEGSWGSLEVLRPLKRLAVGDDEWLRRCSDFVLEREHGLAYLPRIV